MLALLLVAGLALAACGSSSNSTTTATSAASTTGAKGAARFTALRECLKKEGIELPARKTGQTPKPGGGTPGAGGGFFGGGTPGGGLKLPKGVTKAQYEAAIKKCGGGSFRRGNFAGRFSSASYKKALTSFVKCMSSNGVKLPTPNTSGKGPVFDTNKVDVKTAQFKTAESKCSSLLRFARPGAGAGGASGYGGPAAGGGAPPGGAGAPPAGEEAPGA
jgi:hypothetical protein